MKTTIVNYDEIVIFNSNFSEPSFNCRLFSSSNEFRYPRVGEIVPGLGRVTQITIKKIIIIKYENSN